MEPVVVISESLARRYWPGEDSIGKRIGFGRRGENWQTVIGVARDMRDTNVGTDPRGVAYVPYGSVVWRYMTLLVRTESDGVEQPRLSDNLRAKPAPLHLSCFASSRQQLRA